MRAKKRKSGWFVEPETEEEENALIAFLSVYKRVSVSPTTLIGCSAEAEKPEAIVPLLRPGQTEAKPPSHGRGWPPAEPPRSIDRDFEDDL